MSRLERLAPEARVLFAFECALRLLGVCLRYMSLAEMSLAKATVERIVDGAWRGVVGGDWSELELQGSLCALEGVMNEMEGHDALVSTYAVDSLAALSYALRGQEDGLAQEAAWAARMVYEAFDQWVIRQMHLPATADEEAMVLQHPVVQAELRRQERDLCELETTGVTRDLLDAVRARTRDESERVSQALMPSDLGGL